MSNQQTYDQAVTKERLYFHPAGTRGNSLQFHHVHDELDLSSLHSRAITRLSLDPLAPVGGGAGVVGVYSHFKSVGKPFTCRAIL